MISVLVTFLVADFDGNGCDRLRTGLEVIQVTGETLKDAARHLATVSQGFESERYGWIMPGAILALRKQRTKEERTK